MADYIYSVINDFPNHQVDPQSLHQEILDESAITETLDGVNVTGDECKIVFLQTLSGPEETALDGVVAAHDGTATIYIDPVTTHINTIGNPHETTAAEAGASPTVHTHVEADITDLDHDAQKIKGVTIDNSAIADGRVLAYKSSSGNIEYEDPAAGSAVDTYDTGTLVTGSPFESENFINFSITNGWYNASWLYRKKIEIDYTKVGGTLVNFPVLISISSDSDLSAKARSDGYDILFTTSNGATKLNHERVSYSTGTLQAWVKVPKISSSKNTVIYMYYGNSGASDQQNITSTWNNSHKAVYHFENNLLDSTSNDNDGTNNGSSDIAGKVGRARDFSGTSQYISVPYNGTLAITSQVTVEVWVNLANSSNNQKVVSNVSDSINRGFMIGVENGNIYPEVWDSGGSHYTFSSGTIASSQWVYLVMTCAANGELIGYINSSQVNSIPFSTSNIGTNPDDMVIGSAAWSPTNFEVDGSIDEIRISDTIRSQSWITTCYNNQNSPATFISLGSEESDQSVVSIEVVDPIFGSRFTTSNSLTESSTTGSTWLSKLLLTATDLPAGKYRIGWYAEIRETDTGGYVESRIRVNYSDDKASVYIVPQDSNNYYPFGGVAFHDASLESNFIRVNFQWREVGSGTAYIRNARIEIWRVS